MWQANYACKDKAAESEKEQGYTSPLRFFLIQLKKRAFNGPLHFVYDPPN